jgi:hypothetical protein
MPSLHNEAVLHGARIAIPADWEDWTMYRFAAPDAAAGELTPQLRVKPSRKSGLPFRASIIVRRHKLAPLNTLLAVLQTSTVDLAKQNPTMRVLAVGPGEYLGQEAACQDLTFLDPSTQLQLFQRQIAVSNGAGAAVVLTLTTDRNELDEASPGFTFSSPASP